MKPSRLAFLFTAFTVAFLLLLSQARSLADAPKVVDTRTLIASVDAKTNSIVLINKRNNLPHTYKIDDFAKLKVNGVPGKFGDLKAGQEVTDVIERDNDTLDSATVIGY